MVSLEVIDKRLKELNERQAVLTIKESKQTNSRCQYKKAKSLEDINKYNREYEKNFNKNMKNTSLLRGNSNNVDLKDCIAPCFYDMHCDIRDGLHSYYDLVGGRGSTKSSFVSIEIVLGMAKDPNANAVVYRKVADTIGLSVYEQILWAIDKLGMNEDWKCTKNPYQCEYKPYGTRIIFKGLDKALKSKSLKFSKGYAKYLWFEEFSEFNGMEEIRSVQQSLLRGGDKFFIFKSMNPPKSKSNWSNMQVTDDEVREDAYVSRSTYLDVPPEWLGQQFIDDAEWLKESKPDSYRHEYLGESIGTGADVFDNIVSRRITAEERSHFDNIYRGIDWGWYPDPFAFVQVHYDYTRRTLYIFDEFTCNKKTNAQVWDILQNQKGIGVNDLITADSAEPKSIGDLRVWGANIRGAEKGPGSIDRDYKWLQGLEAIIIDPISCPVAHDEFTKAELALDKDGEPIDGAYPETNNHIQDAVRYACERYSKRRGN